METIIASVGMIVLAVTIAAVRWVSFEPLLEDLGEIDLSGISWAVVGGESGPGYRPMDHAWARAIRDQCQKAGVAFFFKQSSALRSEQGILLVEEDGTAGKWEEYPTAAGRGSADGSLLQLVGGQGTLPLFDRSGRPIAVRGRAAR